MRQSISFFNQWISSPKAVASVVPSSRRLARLMTSHIDGNTGPVIELGPGTGVFTRALIERGVCEDRLALVELNPIFAEDLRERFPGARVLCMSAADLAGKKLFEQKAGAVISGLGLLNMPRGVVAEIIEGVFDQLRAGGSLYQFTYGPTCPLPPEMFGRFNLQSQRVGRTRRNIPPATVYRIYR